MLICDAGHRYAVLGLGRLGASLARALAASGVSLAALVSRRMAVGQRLAAELGTRAATVERVGQLADTLFLAVPDAHVAGVAGSLSLTPGQTVVHCSGALDLTVLSAVERAGATAASFHPLQSFPDGNAADRFAGIVVGIEAPPPVADRLARLAVDLGARPLQLAGVDRAAYHAAAVFASNYLVALLQGAADAWEQAGLPRAEAVPALLPLTRGALRSLADRPLAEALTGPVARGDSETVARHLRALGEDPALRQVYAGLARLLLRLDVPADPSARAAIRALLRSFDRP